MAELYECDKGTILNYAKKIGFKNELRGQLTEEQKNKIINVC